ncbi:hypothetical protein BKA93DRAFT_762291 [Sparassis latifolia]
MLRSCIIPSGRSCRGRTATTIVSNTTVGVWKVSLYMQLFIAMLAMPRRMPIAALRVAACRRTAEA